MKLILTRNVACENVAFGVLLGQLIGLKAQSDESTLPSAEESTRHLKMVIFEMLTVMTTGKYSENM